MHPKNTKPPAGGRAGARADKTFNAADYTDNSAATQRARLLAWLNDHHRITTFGARRDLDIPHPAARVQELREAGHNIVTEWTTEEAQRGRPHRIARYVLLAGMGGDQ
jgi:predicted ArsR family transcriptional regulator